jgi:hypothetical protein
MKSLKNLFMSIVFNPKKAHMIVMTFEQLFNEVNNNLGILENEF